MTNQASGRGSEVAGTQGMDKRSSLAAPAEGDAGSGAMADGGAKLTSHIESAVPAGEVRTPVANLPCGVTDCDRERFCRGYCQSHYTRLLKYGDPLYVPAPAAPKEWMPIPPQACKHCGTEFVRTIRFRLYCSDDCVVAAGQERARQATKQTYWSNPEEGRRKGREYYAAHPEKHNTTQHAITCTLCKQIKQRGDMPLSLHPTFVCGDCKTAQRRQERQVTVKCYLCEQPMRREPYLVHTKVYCLDCTGILTRTGNEFGVTREYIRQLVNQRMSDAAVAGAPLTRRVALEQVAQERRDGRKRVTFEIKDWY